MKIKFKFPKIVLEWNTENGQVTTHWSDGSRSDSWTVWEDDYHGRLLGLTPGQHRLQHELAHHLVGMVSPEGREMGGCPIIWRDAHGEEQPQPWSRDREWLITALQYYSRGLTTSWNAMLPISEWGRLASRSALSVELNRLMYAAIVDAPGGDFEIEVKI